MIKRLLQFVVLVALLWAFAQFVVYPKVQANFYRKAIPQAIGADTSIISGDSAGMLSMLSKGACGGAIYRLSDETADAINKQGLGFFKDALHGRGYENDQDLQWEVYTYKPWQQTPVPDEWINEGAWLGLGCIKNGKGELINQIVNEMKKPGSYYAIRQNAELLVMPGLKVVVVTYSK